MSLSVIIGPMFSGKSSRIMDLMSRYSALDTRVLLIKPTLDNRYVEGSVSTHDGRQHPCLTVNKLQDASIYVSNQEVVIIEEAQFFADLVHYVSHWVHELGKNVYVVGLSGDAQMRPFGEILDCIPLADRVEFLTALCLGCKGAAPFTHRHEVSSAGQVLVGGPDVYQALCRRCYLKADTAV